MNPIGKFGKYLSLLCLMCLMFATTVAAQLAQANPWENDIRAFEQADQKNPPKTGGVLFIGSSSIRFWESLQADFPDVPIIRRGFGGSEIRDTTHFADRIIIPYHPRLIVLYAGDNDLAAGRTPEQVRDDFVGFVKRVRRDLPDVGIAYIAIKPSPARANLLDKMREANALISRVAKSGTAIKTIDVFTPMLDARGKPRPELFGDDGLHMNRAGYALWISTIRPFLNDSALK
ncbi:MAG: SGNH/GDSL hydrolase family protein [Dokdonella sp.]